MHRPCPKIGIKIHETTTAPPQFRPSTSTSAPAPAQRQQQQRQQLTPYQPPVAQQQQQQPQPQQRQQLTPYQSPAPAQQQQQRQQLTPYQSPAPAQQQQQRQQPQNSQQQSPHIFYSSDEYLKHHQSQIQHHQQQMQYHNELLKKYQQQQQQPQQQRQPPPQQQQPQPHQQIVPFSGNVGGGQMTTVTNKDEMDFNIDNYQLEDILRLFNIKDANLTDATMKTARKEVLKLHPDKCKMDPKYYEFYQKAYRYLEQVFEFQNRSQNRDNRPTSYSASDVHDEDNSQIVKDFFGKNGGFSTKTFNEQFEKYYVKDEAVAKGYDDWFKSDDGIMKAPEGKISLSAMDSHIENYKRNMDAVVAYKGVSDHIYTGSAAGGALLNVGAINNFSGSTSGDVFSNGGLVYTDLKQAYTETLIPISADEYKNVAKYRNVQEYSAARDMDAKTYKTMDDAESRAYIANQERQQGHEGASLAFYFAKQQEKTKESQNSFWSNLKQLTYGSG